MVQRKWGEWHNIEDGWDPGHVCRREEYSLPIPPLETLSATGDTVGSVLLLDNQFNEIRATININRVVAIDACSADELSAQLRRFHQPVHRIHNRSIPSYSVESFDPGYFFPLSGS